MRTGTTDTGLLAAAVADNIRWCATVQSDRPDVDGAGVWTTSGPPHPLFPDLVTARPGVSGLVADRLAGRSVCSVKDSFADLDLEPHGFTVLFEARWIGWQPSTSSPADVPGWSAVGSDAALTSWSAAAGLPVPLPPHLLAAPDVTILARTTGATVDAGVVVTDFGEAVGVSNVFGPSDGSAWPDIVAAVRRLSPSRPLVGYEHGADLARARAAGFTDLGPLRVWSKPGQQ